MAPKYIPNMGIILLIIIIVVSPAGYILQKAINACPQLLSIK